MSGFIPPLNGKLGAKKLFTGAPIELPLEFLKSHDYVIELEDDSVLRFKSLHCAARSSVHYQQPVIDQTTQAIYSWEECRRIVASHWQPNYNRTPADLRIWGSLQDREKARAAEGDGMKATDKQQLGILSRDVLPVLRAVTAGYPYNIGDSDLYDEQPIHVSMKLGDYRRAVRLRHELENL